MKKVALIAIALFCTSLVWAGNDKNETAPPVKFINDNNLNAQGGKSTVKNSGNSNNSNENYNGNYNGNYNSNVAKQGQTQGQEQYQGQSQSATANNSGNNQSTSYTQVHQTPTAVAPDAFPSAPCRVAGSAAGSGPLFGFSLGASKMDDQCDKRETARSFLAIGQPNAALQILCTTKAAKAAKLDVCGTAIPVAELTATPEP